MAGLALLALMLILAPTVVGVLIGAIVGRLRHERLRQLIQSVALVVGQDLPLGPALHALAKGERRAMRRTYQRLAEALDQGQALSVALHTAQPSCPWRVISAVRAAELGGTTPTILRSLAADLRDEASTRAKLGAPLLYSCLMLGILALVLAIMVLTVGPKLRDIFRDFGTELPPLTQAVLIGATSPVFKLVLAALTLPAALLLALRCGRVRPGRIRVPLTFRAYDALAWSIPVVRRLVENQALGRQLPVLQAALRAGEDLPAAAKQAASVDANYWARVRMADWAEALVRGDDLVQSARASRLPAPFVRALGASRGGMDLPSALEYLTSYYRSLALHWQQVIVSAALPLVVACWAMLVGLIVVSLFLPLVTLLQSMLSSIG